MYSVLIVLTVEEKKNSDNFLRCYRSVMFPCGWRWRSCMHQQVKNIWNGRKKKNSHTQHFQFDWFDCMSNDGCAYQRMLYIHMMCERMMAAAMATKVKFIKHTLSNYNLSICMCDGVCVIVLTVRKISIPPFITSYARRFKIGSSK